MHESEKWKWSRSVMSDSQRPHGLQPTRLLHPWDFPGKSTGVGCHCLLRLNTTFSINYTPLWKKKKKKDVAFHEPRVMAIPSFWPRDTWFLPLWHLASSASHFTLSWLLLSGSYLTMSLLIHHWSEKVSRVEAGGLSTVTLSSLRPFLTSSKAGRIVLAFNGMWAFGWSNVIL